MRLEDEFSNPHSFSRAPVNAAEGIPRKLRSSAAAGDKELTEKLGRNDLCPCGSGRSFQEALYAVRPVRRQPPQLLRQEIDIPIPRGVLLRL
jgi:hypothetical protein